MATIVVDKFINEIGFDFTKKSKDSFASVEKGIKSLRKFALVSAAALTGLGLAMQRVASSIDDQAKFARGIDVSFEKLQQFQFAAKKAGVSVDDLNGFLEGLAKNSASTLPGAFNTALVQLGVTAKDVNNQLKDPATLALELADALKDLPKITQVEFGGRLGASVKMVNLLGEGTDKIVKDMNEAQSIGGIIPVSVTQDVAEFFDDSLLKVNTTLSAFSKTLIASFLPAVSTMLNAFDEWLVVNEKILSSGIAAFIEGVAKGFTSFGSAVGEISGVVSSFFQVLGSGNKNLKETALVSKAVEGVLFSVSAAFLASKVEAILLGAALVKVSITLLDIFKRVDTLVHIFGVEFPSATKGFKESIEVLFSPLDALINKLDKFVAIKDKFDRFSDIVSKINPLKPIADAWDLLGNREDAFKSLGLDEQGAAQKVSSLRSSPQSVTAPASSSNSSTNTSNNVVINVNGAGDPKAVAKEVNNQIDLSTAVKTAHPGFNRAKVT